MSEKIISNNIEAINNALDVSMNEDATVVLYGEDVGFEGGVFRTTQGLQKKYGEERVFDSPIAEASIVGTAIGAAIAGLRPVVEMQFQGFCFPAFQQIITHAARMRNRSRGRYNVPIVVRMPMGGGVRALEHHSESIEALFSHIPGLKVIMPSTPYDSKGLLISAIKCNDPVIFLEPKRVYRSFKQEIPANSYEIPIGKANLVKEGIDLTIVSYGAMLHDCIAACELIKDISIEIIDLRTIKPIDTDTIINSVKKTGRILVVHEAVKSFSVSAEIITRVNEEAFYSLKTKPVRLTGWDITVPYAKGEKYHIISIDRIVETIKEMMKE